MCGIAGIFGPRRPGMVDAMLDAQAHRGPDGRGVWSTAEGKDAADSRGPACTLGHVRLAVIDPAGGAQPMQRGDITVVFNGCIYNHIELKQELEACGESFRTSCDTEIIPAAYARWGMACLDRFIGMFAFALWDGSRRRLLLARDRLGIKPLYYTRARDDAGRPALLFSSEIKGLLASGLVRARSNESVLAEYLTFQAPLGEATLFDGVKRLMPGHWLVAERPEADLRPRKWWDVDFTPGREYDPPECSAALCPGNMDELSDLGEPGEALGNTSGVGSGGVTGSGAFASKAPDPGIWGHDALPDTIQAHAATRLRGLLQDSVSLRLRADVPLGAHLSGGLDSSLVTAMAASISGQPVTAFCGAFDEAGFDETDWAGIAAEHSGARLSVTRPTARDLAETLPHIVRAMDEPMAGPGVFPQYMVARTAAQKVRVVLGGQGGDEFFAGYARYMAGYLEECLKGAIDKTADTATFAATLATIIPNLPMLRGYEPLLRHFWAEGLFGPQDDRYFRLMDRSGSTRPLLSSSLADLAPAVRGRFDDIFHGSNARSFLNRMLHFDLKVHLPALLHVEDRTSMAFGLESRVPLIDHRVCEFMAACPPAVKFAGGRPKHLLRLAAHGLVDRRILNREDKMGFPVPLTQWFRGELRDFVREVLLDPGALARGLYDARGLEQALDGEGEYGRGLWGLLNLELWFREFVD